VVRLKKNRGIVVSVCVSRVLESGKCGGEGEVHDVCSVFCPLEVAKRATRVSSFWKAEV